MCAQKRQPEEGVAAVGRPQLREQCRVTVHDLRESVLLLCPVSLSTMYRRVSITTCTRAKYSTWPHSSAEILRGLTKVMISLEVGTLARSREIQLGVRDAHWNKPFPSSLAAVFGFFANVANLT